MENSLSKYTPLNITFTLSIGIWIILVLLNTDQLKKKNGIEVSERKQIYP